MTASARLHPQVEELRLELLAAGNRPLHELTVGEAREAERLELRPAVAEPVAEVVDRTLPGPAGEIGARFYLPDTPEPGPAFVYFHGGGWVLGSLDAVDAVCRRLANAARCAVVSVDYRLAPEHPFPAALEDCLAALHFVRAQADALGIDAGRVVVAGDSTGANLALATLLALRETREPQPRGAALFYGCYWARLDTASHARFGNGSYRLSTAEMGWFWNNYLGDAQAGLALAEPLYADLAGLPPLHLTLAAVDPLADDTRELAARLAAAGVPHEMQVYPGLVHGFLQMTARCAAARAAMADAGRAIRALLR
jgi:acetyl esterase/lipase